MLHLLFHLRLFVGSSSIAEYHGIAVVSAAMLVHLQVSTQPELADDPCKDPKYQEPAVDAMRAEKDKVRTTLHNTNPLSRLHIGLPW